MIRSRRDSNHGQRGQVLALFTFGSLAVVGMTAVVVDGGNAWGQQRITQNGADAAALAGATVIAERLAGVDHRDEDVLSELNATASAMSLAVSTAEYTDIDGNEIGTTVGSLGLDEPPSDALGVKVDAQKAFGTYFARAVGWDHFDVSASATAITGSGQPVRSGIVPVTPPVNILTCDGQNDPAFVLPPTHWVYDEFYRIPLCKNGPGNVGWIDWTPTSGGTSELADAILDPSVTPPIALPSWQYVTETGNVNSAQVEDAMRTWDGQIVLIPLFDSTCDTEPAGDLVSDCPDEHVGGNGQNQWYHFPQVAAFELCGPDVSGCPTSHGSYINGMNRDECEVGGNGATSCLVGRYVNFIVEGTVTGPLSGTPGPSTVVIVQLVR
jgi:hypothetical protein